MERDDKRAIAYFQAAAARGNEYAQRLLNSLQSQNEQQSWLVTDSALRLLRQTASIFKTGSATWTFSTLTIQIVNCKA